MPQNISVRNWLAQNNYEDVASLVDAVMEGWKKKGTKTRRNWWDVLAGGKNGRPRTIEGITFPVLKVLLWKSTVENNTRLHCEKHAYIAVSVKCRLSTVECRSNSTD